MPDDAPTGGFMAVFGKKPVSPEETAAIVRASAIQRGLAQAQTQIVGILGRRKPFTKVHVGITDVDLGKTVQERNGYAVAALFTASSGPTVVAVQEAVASWLLACHGKRFEAQVAAPVVKPGSKTLYLAVM
jgi:hypothetical protein